MCDDIYEHTQEAIQAVPHEQTVAELQAKIAELENDKRQAHAVIDRLRAELSKYLK